METEPETKSDCLQNDAWDQYPELRNRAYLLFVQHQAERENRHARELPTWRRTVFRVARFLSRYIH